MEEIITGTKIQKISQIKDVPYFLRKYKVRFGLATGLHFQSGLTLLKLFTLGRLICLIKGENLICNNCVKTVKHLPPANLGQSTPDFQINIPSVTKGSFPIKSLCLSGHSPSITKGERVPSSVIQRKSLPIPSILKNLLSQLQQRPPNVLVNFVTMGICAWAHYASFSTTH